MRGWVIGTALSSALICLALPAGVQAGTPTPRTDPSRAAWLQAQGSFVRAWKQEPVVGATASGETSAWYDLLAATATYMNSAAAWRTPFLTFSRAVNSTDHTRLMGYFIQQWTTPLGLIRGVYVSDGGAPQIVPSSTWPAAGPYNPPMQTDFAAQLLLWRSNGTRHAQTLWATTSFHAAVGHTRFNPLTNMRVWRGHGQTYLATLIAMLGVSATSAAAFGYHMLARHITWSLDSTMFPSNPYGGLNLFAPQMTFTDRAGLAVRIEAALINECMACTHVYTERFLQRHNDAFYLEPWRTIPSPYLTYLEMIHAAEPAQAAHACDINTFPGLLTHDSLAATLCRIPWAKVSDQVGPTSNLNTGPPYKKVPTTFAGNTGAHRITLMFVSVGGDWLIDQVRYVSIRHA